MANKTKAELEKEIEDMRNQMVALMAMVGATANLYKEQEQNAGNRKTVTLVNMCRGNFNLAVDSKERYHINGQFSSITVAEDRVRALAKKMPKTFREGRVYIANAPKLVYELGLDDIYAEELLSPEELKNFLNHDETVICDAVQQLTEGQRKAITERLIEARENGVRLVSSDVLESLSKIKGMPKFMHIENVTED